MKLVKIERHLERLKVDDNPFHNEGHVCWEVPASLWELDSRKSYVAVFTDYKPASMVDVYKFKGHGDSIEILEPTAGYLEYTDGSSSTYMTKNARNRLWGKMERNSWNNKNVPKSGYVWCEEA